MIPFLKIILFEWFFATRKYNEDINVLKTTEIPCITLWNSLELMHRNMHVLPYAYTQNKIYTLELELLFQAWLTKCYWNTNEINEYTNL